MLFAFLFNLQAATVTWTNSVSTNNWNSAINWDTAAVPTTNDDVVITNVGAYVILSNATYFFKSLTLRDATLMFTNWNATLSATNIYLQTNSIVTIASAFTNGAMSNRINIVCSNLTMDMGALIDASGKGYAGNTNNYYTNGYGPGAGLGTAGAGYGGMGGASLANNTYGSSNAPVNPGSSGGTSNGSNVGGSGGGAIRIHAFGTVILNGRITADGTSGTGVGSGGGSGGAIYLSCWTLAGSNASISAVGGTSTNGGGGGGGRIAVWRSYDTTPGGVISNDVSGGTGGGGVGTNGTFVLGQLAMLILPQTNLSLSIIMDTSRTTTLHLTKTNDALIYVSNAPIYSTLGFTIANNVSWLSNSPSSGTNSGGPGGAGTPYFVSPAGNDGSAGTSWATAKKTIQAAVDATINGDTVWVTNGTYTLTNQVTVTKGITVRSVNGAGSTFVNGGWPASANRCFYISATNAVLDGFTITNGHVSGSGAGVSIVIGTVQNCVISSNTASYNGGGLSLWYGLAQNCIISGNSAVNAGGGISSYDLTGITRNCLIINNYATDHGGGFNAGKIQNCTVVANTAGISGGGVYEWELKPWVINVENSIVYFNIAPAGSNFNAGTFTNSCTLPTPSGTGNITAEPQFTNAAGGNYKLRATSYCIDGGINRDWMTNAVGLAGNPRILDGTVDMGAYEYAAVSNISTIMLTVNAVGLHPGVSNAIITVTNYAVFDSSNSLRLMDRSAIITVNVMQLVGNTSSVSLSLLQGHGTSTTFKLWNVGPGSLAYTISSNKSWLSVSPASGTVSGPTNTITLTVNSTGQWSGSYSGVISNMPALGGTGWVINVAMTVDAQPEVSVSPGYFTSSPVMVGQSLTNTQNLQISNASATYALGFVLSTNVSWLTLSSSSGLIAASGATNITVSYVNMTNFSVGISNGIITVVTTNAATGDMAIGSPANVNVTIPVYAKPQLSVTPTILPISVPQGFDASQQVFEVWNGNGRFTLGYSISDNVPWLVTSVASGVSTGEHDLITVQFSTTALNIGISNATIWIRGTDTVYGVKATDTPKTISITLQILPITQLEYNGTTLSNSIQQGQSLADATFQIWNESGSPQGTMGYNTTSDVSWLSVSPSSGINMPGSLDTITLSYSPSGLAPGSYHGIVTVNGIDIATGTEAIASPKRISVYLTVTTPKKLDFAGDGSADLVVYNESTGHWRMMSLLSSWTSNEVFGGEGYQPVVGDYDGDGYADLGVYRTSTGHWYVKRLGSYYIAVLGQWGGTGYEAVAGDFDGDGRADFALYAESTGKWYIMNADGSVILWDYKWGGPGLRPVPADYDGDGSVDLGVYEEATGYWYVMAVDGTIILWAIPWGGLGFTPLAADFNGNGSAELALYHRHYGLWFIMDTAGRLIVWSVHWGGPSFTPVVADYNGDGKAELAVYLEASGMWFIQTIDGTILWYAIKWGGRGYIPLGM